MASGIANESEPCFAGAPRAGDVARGVSRLFFRHDWIALCEVSLGNGRRADIMALDSKGAVIIVEIKVSHADLLGDRKWTEYLDYCDRFFWAVPGDFDRRLLARDALLPERCGLIVADAYDAAIIREAEVHKLAAARRRVETLRFARRAATRLLLNGDDNLAAAG